MPKGARKQMTDKQETEYENTKLIPDTLSLIEKELEKSREHVIKTIKETEELKKKIKEKKIKKKSKEEESSSDSSSEDEKPKKKMTKKKGQGIVDYINQF